jgi:hypothetical protein
MRKYRSFLSLRHDGKGIPYFGDGVLRKDGDANYGFKNLKIRPDELDSVPELRDPGLRSLVQSMNSNDSPLFSVGCVSGLVDEAKGHRFMGYIEFALNSKLLVQDASNYFPLFFHFDRFLHKSKFRESVRLEWELMPARFADVAINGFTCTIWINPDPSASVEGATETWNNTLKTIESFFYSSRQPIQDPIYTFVENV